MKQKKLTPAQRRSVTIRTVQAQKMMPTFERTILKERTAEVVRVLDLLKGHRPEQMPDIAAEAFNEPYMPQIYRKLYVNIGVNTARLAINDFLVRKSMFDNSDQWAAVMNDYIAQNAGAKISAVTGSMKEFLRCKVQDALSNSMEMGIEQHTQHIYKQVLGDWNTAKPWMVRRVIQTETMIALSVGQYQSMLQLGVPFQKTWSATFNNTRPQHEKMDGVTVAFDEFFILPNGDKMLYPHDEQNGASPENIINCCCGTFDAPI